MDYEVRQATARDAAAIVELEHALDRSDGKPGALTVAAVLENGFGEWPRFRVLIAERAGQAIGYALYFPSYDSEHAARGVYMNDLYVVPEARRQGVGRALIAAVARACRADGGCYVFWNALESNRAARAFYRRIGAREEPLVTLSLLPEMVARLADAS